MRDGSRRLGRRATFGSIRPRLARSHGCLRCQVMWRGDPVCWVCGDTGTFIVGATSLVGALSGDAQAMRYYPTGSRVDSAPGRRANASPPSDPGA